MSETTIGRRRKTPSFEGRQQVTRIPPYRPDDWVRLKDHDSHIEGTFGLEGRVLRVRSITCSITTAHQRRPIWRIHFDNGRSVEWHLVESASTEDNPSSNGK
jgi:hypothetical protein